MKRLIPALFALFALLLVAVHPAAMASARSAAPVAEAAPPCHGAEAMAVKAVPKADKQPGKAATDCCADGRCSACTPLLAFFRAVPGQVIAFLRAVLEAPVRAAVPLRLADARDRPPKPAA